MALSARERGATAARRGFISGMSAALACFCEASELRTRSVELQALVESGPPAVLLHWRGDTNASRYTLHRRSEGDSGWTFLAELPGSAIEYRDANVAPAQVFEYKAHKNTVAGYDAHGYLAAGIDLPPVENRGAALLLVHSSIAQPLEFELARFTQDLMGDGWTVIRRDVASGSSPPEIRARIQEAFHSTPGGLTAAILVGNLAVPYSGNFSADDHADHTGAWPADVYYADIDGVWTDSEADTTQAARSANWNRPGDGKFDQSEIPSSVELQLGRIDMSNLTSFVNKNPSRGEFDLLRRYFDKNHAFRRGAFHVQRRGLIISLLGLRSTFDISGSGWRNFSGFFGSQIRTSGWQTYFEQLCQESYLWTYADAGGGFTYAVGIGTSDSFAMSKVHAAFQMFVGSYLGDWNAESGFIRSSIAGEGHTVAALFAGFPHPILHHMAVGETIGAGIRRTQNNQPGGLYPPHDQGSGQVHIALLGDPTLRLHPVLPPASVDAEPENGRIRLRWSHSPETNSAGYFVYRAPTPQGPFTRLSSQLSPDQTEWLDTPENGVHTYMVRALKLEQTPSGRYTNLSQGVFATAAISTARPSAPDLAAVIVHPDGTVDLRWKQWVPEWQALEIERQSESERAFQLCAILSEERYAYTDTGLEAGRVYRYRARARTSAGTSAYSREVQARIPLYSSLTPLGQARFIGIDATTQGNWKGVLGNDGNATLSTVHLIPDYAELDICGARPFFWEYGSQDPRALMHPWDERRQIGAYSAPGGFTFHTKVNDGKPHRLSMYFVDWDRSPRSHFVELYDPASGVLLDRREIAGFEAGMYFTWSIEGAVEIRLLPSATPPVLSGLFWDTETIPAPVIQPSGGAFREPVTVSLGSPTDSTIRFTLDGSPPDENSERYQAPFVLSASATLKARAFQESKDPSPTASAQFAVVSPESVKGRSTFLHDDSSLMGDWPERYGREGFSISGAGQSWPATIEVTASAHEIYSWKDPADDPRAPWKNRDKTQRLAACRTAPDQLTLNVDFWDERSHELALYFLDWDRVGRVQLIELFDATTGSLLDQRQISNFADGVYLAWRASGRVQIVIRREAGPNVVVMGILTNPVPISALGLSVERLEGALQLRVQGVPGQSFVIEASPDLLQWSPVSTHTLVEPGLVLDGLAPGGGHQFYRAQSLP